MTWHSLPAITFIIMLPVLSSIQVGNKQEPLSLNGILFTLCSQYDYDTTEMASEVGWCLACFETQWHKKEEEMVEKGTQNCQKSTDIKHLQKQMIKYPIHKVL